MSDTTLRGKVAIVTGATGGIGRAIVERLSRAGVTVHAWDVTLAESEHSHGHRVDVTDVQSVTRALSEVIETSGSPDILVNSAAILVSGSLYEVEPDDFLRSLRVNVLGTFLTTKIVTQSMTSGSVINFASVAGRVASPDAAAYAPTKGAIESFTISVAKTLAERGIRINAVLPGWIDAGFTEKVLETIPDPAAVHEAAASAHLLGRMGDPDEVAKAVEFLAGDGSSFMTGTILQVDGGFLIAK